MPLSSISAGQKERVASWHMQHSAADCTLVAAGKMERMLLPLLALQHSLNMLTCPPLD
jgi:hypothetical protein